MSPVSPLDVSSPSRSQGAKGPIAWMCKKHVVANLLLLAFIVGGVLMSQRVTQEVLPVFDLDFVSISVSYPGASPHEVEQGILLSVEDNVRGIEGVKQVTSKAFENWGVVTIELLTGIDGNRALQDVKNAVDRITTFPENSERPVVSMGSTNMMVLSVMVHGELEPNALRGLAERVREDLLSLSDVTLVSLSGVRDYEIAIEVSDQNLRKFGLTIEEVAGRVRGTAIEIPGGSLKTEAGEILLRTQERRDYARQFKDVPVVSMPDGSVVTLGQIATIEEGFEDSDKLAFFNDEPAIRIDVYRVGSETPVTVAAAVREYTERSQRKLPEGIELTIWNDYSKSYDERVQQLLRNAALGLVLVLLLLGLFLDARLAFWVMLGIPVSILGAFLFFPMVGATINMISLFAFIVSLGIVVDDAIVVGENIFEKREEGLPYLDAAIEGTREISGSVVFAVLTNIVAFVPLLFVPGATGSAFRQIPAVVIFVFLVSLVESLFVLPSHLSKAHAPNRFFDAIAGVQKGFSRLLFGFRSRIYAPMLERAIAHRYVTFATGIAMFMLLIGAVGGGYVSFRFLPTVEADVMSVEATLPFGTPVATSNQVRQRLIDAAFEAEEATEGAKIISGTYSQIGTPARAGISPSLGGTHIVGAEIALLSEAERTIGGEEFVAAWRQATGEISGVEAIRYSATIGMQSTSPIDVEFSHDVPEILDAAAAEFAALLRGYSGVEDIDSGVAHGKAQLSFTVKPEAQSLGLTSIGLARQVRSFFYGVEALRQQRGRNEVTVRVRLPEEERRTMGTLAQLVLRTPSGGEVPFYDAVETQKGYSHRQIVRREGRRVVSVKAEVDSAISNSQKIIGSLKANELPELVRKYPGLSYSLEGEQRSRREDMGALQVGFLLALFVIYALLAIPFNSYSQPLIVMMSIPFGIIGAVIGHALLGYELSIMSLFGVVALSGVVVNDSLVLIVTANNYARGEGNSAREAVYRAALRRFRPIVLTSLTTFLGLAPMIFETSLQARFLIPMAISIGFGVLFATGIILFLVPAFYVILEDTQLFFAGWRGGDVEYEIAQVGSPPWRNSR